MPRHARALPSLTAAALLAAPLALGGCQMNERMTGTGGGAIAGGLIGGFAASSVTGALVGGAAGALAGYLIGDYLADERERCSPCSAPSACAAPDPYAYPTACTTPLPAPVTPPATAGRPSWAAQVAYERGRSAATSEEAVAAYEEALRLDPTRPEPWNALALQALANGDRALARERLLRALALDPTYAPARVNLEHLDRGL